jgi:secernin
MRPWFDEPLGCDTVVALGAATRDGSTILAKNSDREGLECQVLQQYPRQPHPPGASLRCQYLEIPQAAETFAMIGSRPYWLWGFEHGVNEHRVAIGNEAIWTRAPRQETGLLGMDLVRLGLERGRTAREALRVITALLEAHGQGGCPRAGGGAPGYDNSFLIADPEEAWVLETAGRRWVAKRVRDVYAISNVPTIEEEWDEASPDLAEHAREQGWWDPAARPRFNFAHAYGDYANYPCISGQLRRGRSAERLAAERGSLGITEMMAILRDHYGGTWLAPRWAPDEPGLPTICLHPDVPGGGQTAASMVAHLRRPDEVMTCWASFVTPCLGVFLPYYLDGTLPVELAIGGADPSAESPWWQFKGLGDDLRGRYAEKHSQVRAVWDRLEQNARQSAPEVEVEARRLFAMGDTDAARQLLTAFMARSTNAMLAAVTGLRSTLSASTRDPGDVDRG